MTKDEFDGLLLQAANADTAPEALSKIRDGVNDLFGEAETLKAANEASTKQIADLRDTNMRLFLRTTGNVKDEDEHEETVEELNERLRKKLLGDDKK